MIKKASFLLASLAMLTACATAPFEPTVAAPTHAFSLGEHTALARMLRSPDGADAGQSVMRMLATGHEAFAARAALAEAAEHTLDLQYHIVERDDTAVLLLQRLLRAAERGVRVRLLVDDLGVRQSEADLAALAQHANIEVRVFNPFHWRGTVSRALEWLGSDKRLNQRMHNKLWIADNAAGVIGGRNLGDAYFDASPLASFSDLDLLLAGPAVRQASASFDEFWNGAWAVPLLAVAAPWSTGLEALRRLDDRATAFQASDYARALRSSEFGRLLRQGALQMVSAPARVLADRPPAAPQTLDGAVTMPAKAGVIFPALREAALAAQQEIILVTPYFVPGERAVETMCALVARGVTVRVLTNSLASTDVPAVHSAYARHRPPMLACGVKVFELRPAAGAGRHRLSSGATLHAKAVVIDRKWVLMGSMNLDARSRLINTEVALQADSATLGAQLGALFDASTTLDQVWQLQLLHPGQPESGMRWHGIEDGQAVTHSREPDASAWRHVAAALLGWLIDEELL